jgi:hypothetical protein
MMARTKRTKRLYLDDETEEECHSPSNKKTIVTAYSSFEDNLQGTKEEEKEPYVSVQKDRRKRHNKKKKVVLDSDEEQSSKPAPVKTPNVSAKCMQPKLMMP